MAKSRKTDEGRMREKRGIGRKEIYKPWLKPVEVPSTGRSSRLFGLKINRIYNFLSDMERYFFVLYEWSNKVIDIREQYPLLPLIKTEQLARKMRIKHPYITKKVKLIKGVKNAPKISINKNVVMTTDFLVTIKDENGIREVARAIKYKDELKNHRVREKLLIEKAYWESKGVGWKCVTNEDIPIDLAKNILMLRGSVFWLIKSEIKCEELIKLKNIIFKRLSKIEFGILDNKTIDLVKFCTEIDSTYNYKNGFTLKVFKAFIWTQDIEIELSTRLNLKKVKILNYEKGERIESIKFKRYCQI
jgi:hypothetical protein